MAEADVVIKQDYINFFIVTLSENGFNATEIHSFLFQKWGERCPSVRRVQQIKKECDEGTRQSIVRKEGSGRPKDVRNERNIQIIREHIEDDSRLSVRQLERLTDIDQRSVHRILTQDLGKKSLCDRWVPHQLTEHNKANRVELCRELLNAYERRRAMEKIIVIDEKWCYLRDVPPIQSQRSWVDGAEIGVP